MSIENIEYKGYHKMEGEGFVLRADFWPLTVYAGTDRSGTDVVTDIIDEEQVCHPREQSCNMVEEGERLRDSKFTAAGDVPGIGISFMKESFFYTTFAHPTTYDTHSASGVKVGLFNWEIRRAFKGLSLGLFNIGKKISGMQAGLVNLACKMEGIQYGFINDASAILGLQFGLFNSSHAYTQGLQVGIVNIGEFAGTEYLPSGKQEARQIGVVNYSDGRMPPALGVVNLSTDCNYSIATPIWGGICLFGRKED